MPFTNINIKSKTIFEDIIKNIFKSSALFSILITVSIVIILVKDSLVFFSDISVIEFFTETSWNPTIKPEKFGIWPLMSGTLLFTFTTALIALPIGLLTAVFLSEYVSSGIRKVLKPFLELLAGLPTVVYGFFALVYITPFLRNVFPAIQAFNVLSASIVVAIMIIPTIASLSEDAMKAVPFYLRAASYSLGGNKYETSAKVVIPAALSGIVSSFILGISRAIGETMAVTIAAGNLARMVNPLNPGDAFLKPIQTMTAAMVEIGMSDVTGDSIAYKSLFAIGLTLFCMTLLMNFLSQYFKEKFKNKYK
ncbi:MAG TPA: phosphate ABC transporter permease subunit PstC [Spirochaetota bacterium]|nr:phosphate ABC transporter permease subunit PstC [Spirochaetota bacterium]